MERIREELGTAEHGQKYFLVFYLLKRSKLLYDFFKLKLLLKKFSQRETIPDLNMSGASHATKPQLCALFLSVHPVLSTLGWHRAVASSRHLAVLPLIPQGDQCIPIPAAVNEKLFKPLS